MFKNDRLFLLVLKTMMLLISCIALGTILLLLVYCIPVVQIDRNVRASAVTLEKEGVFPSLTKWCTSQLDNYTDSTMMLNAAYNGEETVLEQALMVYSKRIEGLNLQESIVQYYLRGGVKEAKRIPYARYWHGYLVFLKPLLCFMEYRHIRIVNLIIQTLVNLSLMFILYRRKMTQYIVPYIFSICLIMPIATAWSMQFSAVFYIFSVGSIILILNYERLSEKSNMYYYFCFLGILTSYFDFLTYPLATFGVPFTFLVCMNKENKLKEDILRFIKCGMFWCIGYVGMWAGKWIIATLLTGENIIANATGAILNRTSSNPSENIHYSILHVWNVNISAFIRNPVTVLAVIFILYYGYRIIKEHRGEIFLNCCIEFAGICLLPLCWYIFTRNHSVPHYWFTYKVLIITAFAGMCIFVKTLSK